MRRSAKPAKAKVEAKPPIARKSRKNEGSTVHDLEKRLAEALKREAEALKREAEAQRREAEALEQQTATADILRVIASSPTDLQIVLDAVAESAARLCEATDVLIHRVDGQMLPIAASAGSFAATYPAGERFPIARGSVVGRAVMERKTIHVHDLAAESDDEFPIAKEFQRRFGHRTVLTTPLMRKGMPLGAIWIRRAEVRPFTDKQIKLLETFADQAVIAIENVRLFRELQASNTDLREALEQQTATAEILRVISGSHTDLTPVFDNILANACRLCGASLAALWRVSGDQLIGAATYNASPEFSAHMKGHPTVPSREGPTRLAALERRTVHVTDMTIEPGFSPEVLHFEEARTVLSVPLLHDAVLVGAMTMWRREVRPFTEQQVALVQTFADQAVIAIENVRLFTELQSRNRELTDALDQQTATSDILRVISKSPTDLQPVFDPLLDSAVRLCGATHASLYRLDGEVLHHVAARGAILGPRPVGMKGPIPHGTAPGRAILTGKTVQVLDTQQEVAGMPPDAREYVLREGVRTVLAVPLLRESVPIGVIVVRRTEVRPFAENEIRLLRTFADQAVIAIENVRLFKELEMANRELAAASQHKSEFLANMSHELRTPLNAIIGFSEVLGERMFGELNEKQDEYLKDIHASGQHLLSLINDILDLSKIEAGRMELELSEFNLPATLENALTLVRERAGRHGIALHMTVDERLGQVRADERKIRQVVLNLLSNAIKFTPERGRIDVRAVPGDGGVEVSVSDTGVGIAPEDQEAIFEEFRQVGTAAKKVEGTGLGLALSRKFVELHGGRIWVQSQVGVGSTFTFTLPLSDARPIPG